MDTLITNETDAARYEETLGNFPASPFITPGWLEPMRTSRRRPVYLCLESGGATAGCAAGLAIEPPSALLRKIHRPLFLFSGPVGERCDRECISAYIDSMIRYAARNGYTSVQINSWDYPYSYDMNGCRLFTETRHEYILDLRPDFKDIHKAMRRMITRKARKAERLGLTFHESDDPESIADLISLLEETRVVRRSKGYDDYSYFYLPYLDEQVIRQHVRNNVARFFYVAEKGKILCGQFNVAYGQRAYGLLLGSTERGYELGANAYLWCRAIERLQQTGIVSLNLGGIANDKSAAGLIFYKTSLGAEPRICMSGTSAYLQGMLPNLIDKMLYKKLSLKAMRELLHSSIPIPGKS